MAIHLPCLAVSGGAVGSSSDSGVGDGPGYPRPVLPKAAIHSRPRTPSGIAHEYTRRASLIIMLVPLTSRFVVTSIRELTVRKLAGLVPCEALGPSAIS